MIIIDEKDVGKTREQVLLDLIYEATGQRIPLDKIRFGKPREIDKRKDLEFDPNTFIPVRVDVKYDSRYSKDGDGIMYRRRVISGDMRPEGLSKVRPISLPFKLTDILDQINQHLRYPIQRGDIIDREYTTLKEVEEGIKLQADPQSLLWMGSYTFQPDMSSLTREPLFLVTELDGFNEWFPPV